jgi:hypothetical protein
MLDRLAVLPLDIVSTQERQLPRQPTFTMVGGRAVHDPAGLLGRQG